MAFATSLDPSPPEETLLTHSSLKLPPEVSNDPRRLIPLEPPGCAGREDFRGSIRSIPGAPMCDTMPGNRWRNGRYHAVDPAARRTVSRGGACRKPGGSVPRAAMAPAAPNASARLRRRRILETDIVSQEVLPNFRSSSVNESRIMTGRPCGQE